MGFTGIGGVEVRGLEVLGLQYHGQAKSLVRTGHEKGAYSGETMVI